MARTRHVKVRRQVTQKIKSSPIPEQRVAEVYRKTWALVADELGIAMPDYVFHHGDGVVPPSPATTAWAERTGDYTVIHITPWLGKRLVSDVPWERRWGQKVLFHEFRHAWQPTEMWRDPAAREWDASQFARRQVKEHLKTWRDR